MKTEKNSETVRKSTKIKNIAPKHKIFNLKYIKLVTVLFVVGLLSYYLYISYNAKLSLSNIMNVISMQTVKYQNRGIFKDGKPEVVIITTGGTIASSSSDTESGFVPALSGDVLVQQVPELTDYAKIRVHEYSNIDSKDMEPADWVKIARLVNDYLEQDNVAGVVISHGTDTMEYTAFFLEYTINSNKPCVLTGAMLASSERNPDGPRNLISAVRVASDSNTPDNLVGIVFNNRVISGMAAKKIHSTNLDAFYGGDHGYLGNIDPEGVTWLNLPINHKKFALPKGSDNTLPRVDIINVYPGVDDSFLQAAYNNQAQGLVIVGYGAGNTNQAIALGLDKFFDNKIPVIIDSIAPHGRSLGSYGGVGGGAYFKEKGAILGNVMSPGKARILLMLALANNIELNELKTYLDYID